MKIELISCEFCGIVIDPNRNNFTDKVLDMDYEDPEYEKYYAWNSEESRWSLTINCPFCETRIFLSNGDKV